MAKFKVTLTQDERDELRSLVNKGKAAARKIDHARILLLADEGEFGPGKTDLRIVEAPGAMLSTRSGVSMWGGLQHSACSPVFDVRAWHPTGSWYAVGFAGRLVDGRTRAGSCRRWQPLRGNVWHRSRFSESNFFHRSRSISHHTGPVMPQSLAQIYLHFVFSTKNRQPFLENRGVREGMHAYLVGTCEVHRVRREPDLRLWQDGYGAFSVRPSHVEGLIRCIRNQEPCMSSNGDPSTSLVLPGSIRRDLRFAVT